MEDHFKPSLHPSSNASSQPLYLVRVLTYIPHRSMEEVGLRTLISRWKNLRMSPSVFSLFIPRLQIEANRLFTEHFRSNHGAYGCDAGLLSTSLIGWGIDLNLTGLHGSTALHYTFLCNGSACAVLLIRSGADELALDEPGRSAWDLNPSLADECTSRPRDVPKVDGSFSASCRPAEESEIEHAEEVAALEATYLLVQRWLLRMKEERCDTNDLIGGHMPQLGISPLCLPSKLGDRNGKKLSTLSNHPLIERLLLFT